MSRLKKQTGPVVLATCVAAGGRKKASLSRFPSTLNPVWAQNTIQPPSPTATPAAECSSFHQVAPLVFTVYGLSSSACLIPLVRINTCFKLLVNKTEHRYECVIKRWENGCRRLLVVFVCLFSENVHKWCKWRRRQMWATSQMLKKRKFFLKKYLVSIYHLEWKLRFNWFPSVSVQPQAVNTCTF